MTYSDDTSLHALLAQLCDPQADLAAAPLESLSDIDAPGFADLEACWAGLPEPRRLDLIKRIGLLADDNVRLAFDRVNALALRDTQADVRQAAIRNLWESDDASLINLFLERLAQDPSTDVRASAAAALGHFVYLGELGEIKADSQHKVEAALMALVPAADDVGLRSLESLGYSSRPDVIPLIENAYANGALPLRRSALLAMGRSCDERWSDRILGHLQDPSPELRLEAVRAAGDLELREATPDVIDLLDDVHQPTRHAAIWTLGQLGGKEALRALSRHFDRAENDEEAGLLRDALDNLAFVDGMGDFLFMDADEDTAHED